MRILRVGDQARVGKVKAVKGEKWLEIIFPDKVHGFIPGDTQVFLMRRVVTNQPETKLYATAGRESVKATLKRRSTLDLIDMVEQNGEKWLQCQDKAGNAGYIEAGTKVLKSAKPTVANGVFNILTGGIVMLAGFCYLLAILGTPPIDWFQLVTRLLWSLLGLMWLISGIIQIVEASK